MSVARSTGNIGGPPGETWVALVVSHALGVVRVEIMAAIERIDRLNRHLSLTRRW